MKWKTEKNKLLVNGEAVAELPYPILEASEVEGTVILVLDVPSDVVFSDNTYGYVLKEARLWQIEPSGYYDVPPETQIRVVGISPLERSGEVTLFTWLGILVHVNVLTGKVVGTQIGK